MKSPKRKAMEVVLIFGESVFDSQALQQLVIAARPGIPITTVIKRPPTLRREADVVKHRKRTGLVIKAVRAAQVKYRVKAVITHRDLDQVEPADDPSMPSTDETAHCIELKDVADLGVDLIATAPAWEMETWWLMWPIQVGKVRPSWNHLTDRSGTRVDKLHQSKELLRRELRRQDKPNLPDYSETDAPRIAAIIREDNVVRTPSGRSIAFERFIRAVDKIKI